MLLHQSRLSVEKSWSNLQAPIVLNCYQKCRVLNLSARVWIMPPLMPGVFNNAFNGKVFQIVDGRNSMTALSGSLPMYNNSSIVKDDIERIEVVLGPQTALYGPNAHNAIINFITKDPRTSQGTISDSKCG